MGVRMVTTMLKQRDSEEILAVLERYKRAIHTQSAADFLPIWAQTGENVLISPAGCFRGTEAIYRDFLLGRIRAAYTQIDLITESVALRALTADSAAVVFAYRTACIRRETGEPHGLRAWKRRSTSGSRTAGSSRTSTIPAKPSRADAWAGRLTYRARALRGNPAKNIFCIYQ